MNKEEMISETKKGLAAFGKLIVHETKSYAGSVAIVTKDLTKVAVKGAIRSPQILAAAAHRMADEVDTMSKEGEGLSVDLVDKSIENVRAPIQSVTAKVSGWKQSLLDRFASAEEDEQVTSEAMPLPKGGRSARA